MDHAVRGPRAACRGRTDRTPDGSGAPATSAAPGPGPACRATRPADGRTERRGPARAAFGTGSAGPAGPVGPAAGPGRCPGRTSAPGGRCGSRPGRAGCRDRCRPRGRGRLRRGASGWTRPLLPGPAAAERNGAPPPGASPGPEPVGPVGDVGAARPSRGRPGRVAPNGAGPSCRARRRPGGAVRPRPGRPQARTGRGGGPDRCHMPAGGRVGAGSGRASPGPVRSRRGLRGTRTGRDGGPGRGGATRRMRGGLRQRVVRWWPTGGSGPPCRRR